MAPKYHGPDINALSPQYVGMRRPRSISTACWGVAPRLTNTRAMFDSESTTRLDPPPYAFGTKKVKVSPMPCLQSYASCLLTPSSARSALRLARLDGPRIVSLLYS